MADDRERLEQLFQYQLDAGLHHGAQLAVYHDGENVLNLAGGTTGPDGDALGPDDRMLFFSATKPLTAACVHQLVERGDLAYDDRIVDHWPTFADADSPKADVTVRHVLSHQGGFPYSPFDGSYDDWTDWETVVEAMEDLTVHFEPGSTAAYHPMNYGWVLGELVRRVSGREIGAYAREYVFEPLGMMETYIGLPDDVPDDVATLVAFDEFDRVRKPDGGLDSDHERSAQQFNREAFHRAPMPAANGVGTAGNLARFYAAISNGGRLGNTQLLAESTVAEATSVTAEVAEDATLGGPRRYALGFVCAGTPHDNYGTLAPEQTVGHAGLGSSVGWADPDADLAFAYVTNGIRDSYEHRARVNAMADAVRKVYANG